MKIYENDLGTLGKMERLNFVKNQLADETENPATLHDADRNNLLRTLLMLVDFIDDDSNENPLFYWFPPVEEEK
jgi:hypothetical protein